MKSSQTQLIKMTNNCHTILFQERLLIQFHYILIATLEKKVFVSFKEKEKIRRTILKLILCEN